MPAVVDSHTAPLDDNARANLLRDCHCDFNRTTQAFLAFAEMWFFSKTPVSNVDLADLQHFAEVVQRMISMLETNGDRAAIAFITGLRELGNPLAKLRHSLKSDIRVMVQLAIEDIEHNTAGYAMPYSKDVTDAFGGSAGVSRFFTTAFEKCWLYEPVKYQENWLTPWKDELTKLLSTRDTDTSKVARALGEIFNLHTAGTYWENTWTFPKGSLNLDWYKANREPSQQTPEERFEKTQQILTTIDQLCEAVSVLAERFKSWAAANLSEPLASGVQEQMRTRQVTLAGGRTTIQEQLAKNQKYDPDPTAKRTRKRRRMLAEEKPAPDKFGE